MKNVSFRPITPADEEFLAELYASTRQEEMALVDWPNSEKEDFLRQQFRHQYVYYGQTFAEAQFHLVLLEGEPIGRLYVDRRPDEIRLIDIALLPGHRNRGIGSWLMRNILDEAHQSGRPVRIHVEKFNPAMRLYQRLGFKAIEDVGVYFLMECRP